MRRVLDRLTFLTPLARVPELALPRRAGFFGFLAFGRVGTMVMAMAPKASRGRLRG